MENLSVQYKYIVPLGVKNICSELIFCSPMNAGSYLFKCLVDKSKHVLSLKATLSLAKAFSVATSWEEGFKNSLEDAK